jgi:hypothetical protein
LVKCELFVSATDFIIPNLEENWSFSPGNAEPQLRFDAPNTQTGIAELGLPAPGAEVFESSINLKEMVFHRKVGAAGDRHFSSHLWGAASVVSRFNLVAHFRKDFDN